MEQYIDKADLVAEIEKLQSEIAEEKKLHEDNSMWYNGINHGFNLTKDILNDLKVKEVEEEPVSIDFEKELYKAFGQVRDFTLGMRIAKRFYDMGKNSQEPVSEDLEEAAMSYGKSIVQHACDELRKEYGGEYTPGEDNVLLVAKYFKAGAQWQEKKDQSTIELAEDHAMLAGMEKMKEEMVKDSVDGIVYSQRKDMAIVRSNVFFPTDLKKGDKVKLIIIKENVI